MRINVYSFYIFISVASLPNNLRDLADFTCNLQAKFMLPKVALTSCLQVPFSMKRESIPGKMTVKSSHADIAIRNRRISRSWPEICCIFSTRRLRGEFLGPVPKVTPSARWNLEIHRKTPRPFHNFLF